MTYELAHCLAHLSDGMCEMSEEFPPDPLALRHSCRLESRAVATGHGAH